MSRLLILEKFDINGFIDMPPKSRNEKVAQSMFMFNLCEKRGSGMDRAVAGVEEMRLPAIRIEKGEYFTRASLFPLVKYTEMSKSDKVQLVISIPVYSMKMVWN